MFSSSSTILFGLAAVATLTQAQNLADAIKPYSDLTQFASLLAANPNLIPSDAKNQTLLIPTDAAFANYQAQTGSPASALTGNALAAVIQYHTLDGSYDATALKAKQGLIAPTLLTGDQYNHRGNSSVDGKKGQVVYISTSNNTIAVRQQDASGALVKSGAGMEVTVNATDATWSGGLFHPITGFLTIPVTCTDTMKTNSLNSLLGALATTNLSDTLNGVPGVTCLAPSNAAFAQAGNVSDDALKSALLFHTIPMPLYTPDLHDGQILMSASNQTVKVSIKEGQLYYNDAMVINSNVLTNNGLLQVLDKVMSPTDDSTAPSSSSSAPSSTSKPSSSGTASGTSSATAATSSKAAASTNQSSFLGLFGAVILGLLFR